MENAILLVDDEVNVTSALKRALIEEPYTITTASSGEEGLIKLAAGRFKVVMSDERMPGMGGAEFLSQVRERYPDMIRMMLTGHASLETAMKAVNQGEIYRFFTKPWNDHELILAIRSAFEKYDLEEENRRLLRTVRRQTQEIRMLESAYPGIGAIHKDTSGSILIDVSDDELAEVIERCNREY